MTVTWLLFILCTAVILIAGFNLSKYGDAIADITGLGRTWIGVILLASVTSLPELITGLSAVAIFAVPDIAVGDVLGSCMFNLLIVALLIAFPGSAPISARARQGQVLVATFGILLLGLVSMSIVASDILPSIGWISISSFVFIALYMIAMRTIFAYEQQRNDAAVSEVAMAVRSSRLSPFRTYTLFGLNATLIIAAATYLPQVGAELADATNLGHTFFGTVFIALSTSLPEVAVSVAALKIGAIDMAFGNVFGSNLFNVAILALDDVFYLPGPLLANVSPSHVVPALAAMTMTAVAVIGLIYRGDNKRPIMAWDALGIIAVYLLAMAGLYLIEHS